MTTHINIIFVCTGNTCRSPMAEYAFKRMLREEGMEEAATVTSAGIRASEGSSAAANAVDVLGKESDIERHQSSLLSTERMDSADWIICMTEVHKKVIIEKYPSHTDKVFTILSNLNTIPDDDIPDPIGSPVDVYHSCLKSFTPNLIFLINKLKK